MNRKIHKERYILCLNKCGVIIRSHLLYKRGLIVITLGLRYLSKKQLTTRHFLYKRMYFYRDINLLIYIV